MGVIQGYRVYGVLGFRVRFFLWFRVSKVQGFRG